MVPPAKKRPENRRRRKREPDPERQEKVRKAANFVIDTVRRRGDEMVYVGDIDEAVKYFKVSKQEIVKEIKKISRSE